MTYICLSVNSPLLALAFSAVIPWKLHSVRGPGGIECGSHRVTSDALLSRASLDGIGETPREVSGAETDLWVQRCDLLKDIIVRVSLSDVVDHVASKLFKIAKLGIGIGASIGGVFHRGIVFLGGVFLIDIMLSDIIFSGIVFLGRLSFD
jgi:hypothetical protein